MKRLSLTLALLLPAVSPALAGDDHRRDLDKHVHGESVLNIAIEGKVVEVELEAPGADIVGFEHPAHDADHHAAVDAAKARLMDAANVLKLPAAAGCEVEEVEVDLHGDGEDHDDHDHGKKHDHDHDHDKEHGEHEGENHTEFHAHYHFGCADPDQITGITFPFFDSFEHSKELAVQLVSRRGASAHEVDRDNPAIELPNQN